MLRTLLHFDSLLKEFSNRRWHLRDGGFHRSEFRFFLVRLRYLSNVPILDTLVDSELELDGRATTS